MNNDDKELLGGIYKLSETGMEATKTVLPKVKEQQLKNELQEQYNDYSAAKSQTEQALVNSGVLPQDQGVIAKAAMWGSIQLHTLAESSSDHIAEIMINGTTMGVIDLTKHIGACPNADKSVKDYAQNFIRNEERHIDNLKAFLC
ncbi:MAG: hypothetical protein IJ192_13445 [Clostridia bacterium]|nr:hypothetical protein [Clostridia bacterium]